MKRVVITGAGTINALGHSVPETLEAMRNGRCGIGELEFRDVDRLAIRIGGQVRGFGAEGRFNRQQLTLYDRFTQFTLVAAKEAIAQSGIEFSGEDAARSGVVLGTAGGGVSTWDDNYRSVYEDGKNRASFCGAQVDEQRGRQPCLDGIQPQGAILYGLYRLRIVQSRNGAGVSAGAQRGGARDDHRRRGIDVVLWRRESLGGVARDVQGCLPPVQCQPQWHGAGRRRGDLCV